MSESWYVQLLSIASGVFLLAAVLVLWRRELSAIIRVFALQGAALAGMVAVLATQERSVELWVIAIAIGALRAGVIPALLRRALASSVVAQRETKPVVNIAASLLAAAVLSLLAYVVSVPIVELAPAATGAAVPAALAVVLIGFFVLVTRRHALSQVVGFLLMDNGITAVAFLTTAGVGLVLEIGVSLDILLVVLVLHVLTSRMREVFGDADLDELRELRD